MSRVRIAAIELAPIAQGSPLGTHAALHFLMKTTKEKMMKMTLAEALLRRKELAMKVQQLQQIKASATFEVKATRKPITESIDDVIAQVPKLTAAQVTAEYDHYARALRRIDASIQKANWETQIDVDDSVDKDYEAPKAS